MDSLKKGHLHKEDTFAMVSTLYFPLWRSYFLRHKVQPKILVLIINFLSLNFTSMELEWERLSSNQNERTLGVGEGGARKRTRTNKGGGGERGQNSGISS